MCWRRGTCFTSPFFFSQLQSSAVSLNLIYCMWLCTHAWTINRNSLEIRQTRLGGLLPFFRSSLQILIHFMEIFSAMTEKYSVWPKRISLRIIYNFGCFSDILADRDTHAQSVSNRQCFGGAIHRSIQSLDAHIWRARECILWLCLAGECVCMC